MISKKIFSIISCVLFLNLCLAQNPLFIPPSLTGTNFDLTVQSGTKTFYGTTETPTFGINGSFLSPTIIVNKGDVVTLNVINTLNVRTTMHWHGLHVSAMNDGGPHQMIMAGETWSPTFEILNNAGTFWYHPHGEGKTELHVSKGLAGMFIIHDPEELALGLPQTYGVDDFPLIAQTKAFDALTQIAIADHMDTAVFMNGTLDAYLDAPAQVIRLRLLNGSSMRTFNFGFSNNMTFSQIATDGGLIGAPNQLTRLMLAPGERSEILVDLSALNGQSLQLLSYGSEMPDGIFGAPMVGTPENEIHMYEDNLLNGTDFTLLDINVVAPTTVPAPVTLIPTSLVPFVPYDPADATVTRTLVLDTIRLVSIDTPNLAEGPFGINNEVFHMDSINIEVPLNSTEIWSLVNNTLIAHPFHIHDIQFNIIEKNGLPPTPQETGWKDVVLVMPQDTVKFLTKFITFADDMTPYMYHCHLLHHEDDGMMGSFIVYDSTASVINASSFANEISIYPNPSSTIWNIKGKWMSENVTFELVNILGEKVYSKTYSNITENDIISIPCSKYDAGIYLLNVNAGGQNTVIKLNKN